MIINRPCDEERIARSLIANNNLVQHFATGRDRPAKPCAYRNKCLVSVAVHPLGCYEFSRFDGEYAATLKEVILVLQRAGFERAAFG